MFRRIFGDMDQSASALDSYNQKIAKLDRNGVVQSDIKFDEKKRIYNDASQWSGMRRTILENCMLNIINSITDKPDWETKLQDEAIRNRWRKEIAVPLREAVNKSTEPGEHDYVCDEGSQDNDRVTDLSVDFVVEELQDRATRSPADGYIAVIENGGADIAKSDSAVSRELKERIAMLTTKLAQSQPEPWWQPGEEGIVRHLIHPSLYAFESGTTKVLTDGLVPLIPGSTEGNFTIPASMESEQISSRKPQRSGTLSRTPQKILVLDDDFSMSNRQWIPAEIALKDGKASFASAINNLDYEQHPELYRALAELVDSAIPTWERCLAIGNIYRKDARRVLCVSEHETLAKPTGAIPPRPNGPFIGRYREEYHPDDGYGDDYADQLWEKSHQYNICPPPGQYQEFRERAEFYPVINLLQDFDHLQVIVKISGIYLTPENPEYKGGSWHVEGLAHESICATSVFYYDSLNITDSSISFRAGASMDNISDFEYPQSEFEGANRVFGTDFQDGEAIQDMPTIVTKEGRLLTFPNTFQHRVSPFRLADPDRPGHRKIVVLWLVNPQKRIISTAHVPPQQRTMSRTEAIERQKRIMKERSAPSDARKHYRSGARGDAYGDITETYCFCEH